MKEFLFRFSDVRPVLFSVVEWLAQNELRAHASFKLNKRQFYKCNIDIMYNGIERKFSYMLCVLSELRI